MKNILAILVLLLAINLSAQEVVSPEHLEPVKVVDTYHGVEVEDDYRYIENMQDPKVLNWMKESASYAESVLDKIPGKEDLMKKMLEMDSRQSSIVSNLFISKNDDYYYLKRLPEDETGKLYYRKGFEGAESLIFDPENYKKDGEVNYTIHGMQPSISGEMVAVRLAPNGSETGEIVFIDKDGTQHSETLELAAFNISWDKNDQAIFYPRFNSADISDMTRQMNTQTYKHILGDDPKNDIPVFSNTTNPELKISPMELPILIYEDLTDQYYGAVVSVDKAAKIYMAENEIPGKWKQVASKEDMIEIPNITKHGVYYLTFKDASNYKIVKSSLEDPSPGSGEVVVEEPKNGTITGIFANNLGLFYSIKENGVRSRLYYLSKDSEESSEIELPFVAGNIGLSGTAGSSDDVWVNLIGWTQPLKRYHYNVKEDKFTLQTLSSAVEYPELKDLMVEEIMVKSHDGIEVPVSIIYNKDLKMDGSNPAMIYGYGSYGISTGPFFSPITLAYTTYGGILVVPHVRGGGELGDAWHRAGQKQNKPNTWKDAIATAEYLIDHGYTSSDKLSILGGSAGGIFVGRSITERPDLFAAAAPEVGVMNPVRAEETPNGPVNAPEFGTVKDEGEFKGLMAMDSYHALKEGGKYPAMLITAGMNDPRVIAWQPAKFAAKAQNYSSSDAPILFLTDFESGHGIGDNKTKAFESFANAFSFFYWQSGHPLFQPNEKLKK
ncbi:prolyl oligopeptidase family serine peptidase [Gramella sp. AN32]|uniref:prolyl oligopeptidase n=1 Tax=Christiangramia antarctica TaxID=2058158 RepID=A0ABW5XBS7_9FLAO|nr:prolyl oligopeptidase family serine peptidase [Gramella sp. AN32]MCM4157413.1 S9 family peptidase [Gramella sp. AN32]